jgi:lipopolysaccharide cholinephosphotransferase
MRELSLRELQLFTLDILKDVHTFCINNQLHYSVAFGTLIGAIRHRGFIPWDDDIDIVMPRPDYERFCQTYHSERFHLKHRGNDKKCMITFARVYDN